MIVLTDSERERFTAYLQQEAARCTAVIEAGAPAIARPQRIKREHYTMTVKYLLAQAQQ